MKKIIPVIILACLMASCRQSESDKMMVPEMAGFDEGMAPMVRQAVMAESPPVEKTVEVQVDKKKIIKDGRMGLRVTDLDKTKGRIDSLVNHFGGYYANESFNNTDWETSYNLNIRIPGIRFEQFIIAVESGQGEILHKNIDARDVTDQFIDLETRLANKRSYLKRYNELLGRANTIKEILEVEEKIRVLEEEIESTTGRLRYLSDLVDYSTLDLTITKPKDFKYKPADRDKFTERLKQSLSKGWFGLVDFLLGVIRIWPFWIVVAVGIYFLRKYLIARKRN